MHKRKKIITIIVLAVLVLGAGSVLVFRKIKSSHQVLKSDSQNSSAPGAATSDQSANVQSAVDNSGSDNGGATDNSSTAANSEDSSGSSAGDNTTSSLDVNKTNADGGQMLAHITTQHCNDDCKAFANQLDLFEYCQQVCGITPVKKVSNCDGKDGIEKDYCLKDLGITKDDTSICGQISDANVKNTCKNRVLQDIIEQQQGQQQLPPG